MTITLTVESSIVSIMFGKIQDLVKCVFIQFLFTNSMFLATLITTARDLVQNGPAFVQAVF